MKYINMLLGFLVFSVVVTFFLGVAGTMGEEYQSNDYQLYKDVENSYDVSSDVDVGNSSSVSEGIASKIAGAVFSSVGGDAIAKDVLDSLKLIGRSPATAVKITTQVSKDAGFLIPEIFLDGVRIAFAVTAIIITMIMIWRFKPDTD